MLFCLAFTKDICYNYYGEGLPLSVNATFIIGKVGEFAMKLKILILEDDHVQNDVLANFLKKESFEVLSAYTIAEARKMLDDTISLIIVDVMLPDGNGLDFLAEIRKNNNVPVIVLTALNDEYTQINTFELKADEYVDKPVSPVVMAKRVKALLGRIYGLDEKVKICGFNFDFSKYTVLNSEGEEIKLTTKEVEIVKCLYDNKGNAVTRDNLINGVWGYEYISDERFIDTHIKNIRKKLTTEIILTVKSVGYRLNLA